MAPQMHDNAETYIRQCLLLAEAALQAGNPPVGALLVLEDGIIGTGTEAGKTTGDITDHAEILAVRDAIKNGYGGQLHRAHMYTTHEPCIMCSYVLRHHKIPAITYGAPVPYIGGHTSRFGVLHTKAVPQWGQRPVITGGVCREECDLLTSRYVMSGR